MRVETSGIVLYEQSIGEKDKLITILTQKEGIIRAFVRGAKKLSDRKSTATQQFCYSNFSIYKGKEKFTVNEAVPIEIFFNLHKEIQTLALAQYFCELSLAVVPQNSEARDFLRLILNSLHLIANTKKDPMIVKSVFELKLISMAGYMPDLVACKGCQCYSKSKMYFCVDNASLYCKDCFAEENKSAIMLPPGVLTAMRHIIYSEFEKIFSFNLSEENIKNLSKTTEKYILYTLNRRFKTLEFLKNIM